MFDHTLFSSTLYPHFDTRTGNWVIAFDEDGRYYADADPASDFYVPVPHAYASREGAEAGIAVIAAWDAPVAHGEDVLGFEALRATPEWARLAVHIRYAIVPDLSVIDFADAPDVLPGAFKHYLALILAGVQVL